MRNNVTIPSQVVHSSRVVPTGNVLYYIHTNPKNISTNDEENDYTKPGSE